KPGELLGICKVLFEELHALGFSDLRNAMINIYQDDKGFFLNYDFSRDLNPSITNFPSYDCHPLIENVTRQIRKSRDAFAKIVLTGEELESWKDFRKENGELPDPELEKSSALYYYFYSVGIGAVGISTFEPVTGEQLEILKRFRNVFDLAYRRYTDIEQAETQTREAQIEAALERVRSRAMSMQTSEELNALIGIVFTELTKLDLVLTRCVIMIYNPETYDARWWMANSEAPEEPMNFLVKYHELPPNLAYFKGWQERVLRWQYILEGIVKKEWDDFIFSETELSLLPDFVIAGMKAPRRVYLNASFNNFGNLTLAGLEPLSNEHFDILLRFAKVFDLTYTRFNDLKQAEAQAKEAQIELALERVRARTMAMQKSSELREVAAVVFEQMGQFDFDAFMSLIVLHDKATRDYECWMPAHIQTVLPHNYRVPYFDHPFHKLFIDSLQEGIPYKVLELSGETKRTYDELFFTLTDFKNIPESAKQMMTETGGCSISSAYMNYGSIEAIGAEPLSKDNATILQRFAKVFEQTYTRFLDLQKAEAQTREAQREAALERVRAKTMAMHNSDDVGTATATMFTELEKLGIENLRGGITNIRHDQTQEVWSVNNMIDGKLVSGLGIFDMNAHVFWKLLYKGWENKEDFLYYHLAGKEKEDYIKILNTLPNYLAEPIHEFPDVSIQVYYFGEGAVWMFSLQPHSEGDKQLMKRFTSVFSLTFRRYQDLKKAEAQLRETQIEAALERVRSRTMAMQKSEELAETAAVVFKQMIDLGISPNRLYISIIHDDSGDLEFWITDEDGNKVSNKYIVNVNNNISIKKMFEGWAANKKSLVIDMQGDQLTDWLTYWNKEFQVPFKQGPEQKRRIQNIAYFSKGFIAIASPDDQPVETTLLLDRFAKVFDLTYTRFNDLQQAEAQAREANIEAALEKVRGKAMAMHDSKDLSSTASMVFTELRKLRIRPIRCGVGLLNKESRKAQLYSATSSVEGDSLALVGWVILSGHPVLENIYDAWLKKEDYFPLLTGEQLRSYYELLLSGLSVPSVPDGQSGEKQYGHFLPVSVGCLYAWSENPYNDTEIKILNRFASIVDLTFRRYIELQKSEANTKEAVRQASLDRVRAEIASMRTTRDLEKITPLIWNELTTLGVPFNRCGVFIMDDTQEIIHTFLSTPEGKAIAAFHMPYTTPGNISRVLAHWRIKRNYIDHWNEAVFAEFAGTLVKQGALTSPDLYLQTIPAGGFHLHFLPFLQGMLYVGNTTRLGDDEIKLIRSVADAFSTAYARYEDFNKLESAKLQIEKTLVDLKQAQAQLVQSEKMASLGELTAGIAHEIQNPLNFVNNFSDVNTELIEELKNELKQGNNDEVIAIANDIKANEEKINHHGKRADAIVKGMLQHSRSNSSIKEPANINALADEYLRLSYHGFRAKDKLFNTAIQTDFDNTINKIDIIAQDIARVLLNLYNNAFYAVNEKKRSGLLAPQGGNENFQNVYEPSVSVGTKKIGDHVLITVKDNGNGIPEKIVDKIFQPFFTTKPTGQGTGLGLSLSYDIVKAHGGKIKVTTKEEEGTEFIIQLPTY
ncbi:MAG: hypothetical protein JWM28_4146, partial [Chitinophagaceae bacterium]|nr:hypothetical protein [Chitinophagaceae bacterium]